MDKQELQSRAWYRLLKVVYIIISILILVLGYYINNHYDSNVGRYTVDWDSLFVWVFWQLMVGFIIYKTFLYIITGKFK